MRLTWFVLMALITSCSGPKNAGLDTLHAPSWDAPFTILDAHIEGDSLHATVQYGGGFREHLFRLESKGTATKSLPRKQELLLLHEGHGDMGRALIQSEHAFDLAPFRDPSQSLIKIRLDGWPEWMDYTYPH